MTLAVNHESELYGWARAFTETAAVAVRLAATPFVPASLRVMSNGVLDEQSTAANVTSAILTGQELGLQPMAALRSIDIINGTPALRALALRALVLRAGHSVWVAESTTTRAVVRGRRKDATEAKPQESVWTIDRARTAGLAGKPNWRTQPGAMLVARATAELCRWIAPEELLGLPYIAEELADGSEAPTPALESADAPAADTDAATADTQRRAYRRARPVETVELPPVADTAAASTVPDSADAADQPSTPVTAPRLVEPADGATDGEPAPDMITSAQRGSMMAAFRALKMTDRTERLRMTEAIVNRPLESANMLTAAEASHVLDELTLLAARESVTRVTGAVDIDPFPYPKEDGPDDEPPID